MAIDVNIPSQVKNYANLATFPATGSLKTIFIAEDTNKTYRWTGSAYVEISATAASTWGAIGGTLSNQTDLQTALNAKQDSLGFTAVPNTRTLTINGTTQDLSADRTFTVSTGITIGTTAITSGTVGRVLFEGTGNVVQESANLFWDNTNGRLGIGTNAPSGRIHVKGSVASEIFKAESTIAALYAQFVSTDGAGEFGIYTDAFYFQPLSSLANGTRFLNGANTVIMQLAQTGNVLINTTTDAGYKLDVNGTARVVDNVFLTNGIIANTTGTTRLQGSTNYFTHNRLGSSGALGFQISQTGILSSFWRWTDATNDVEFGNARNASLSLFTNNTVKAIITGGGNVLINTTTDVASSKLTIESTTQGFLPPRMTTTQKNAIASPATGLMVYDTTLNLMSVYNGTSWITL